MAEFTKEEQVQAIYDLKVGYTLGHADIAMLKSMARQLLAGMEQEPVAQVYQPANIGICAPLGPSVMMLKPLSAGTKLYAAPQLPQPAVVVDRKAIADMVHGQCSRIPGATFYNAAELALDEVEACRAAMLQGAEPVSQSDELPMDYLQGHKDGLEWAARLAEANHPQTGDWLYDDPLELAKAIRKGPYMPGEPVQKLTFREAQAAIRNLGPIDAGKIQAERDALNEPTCWCHACRPVTMNGARFVVCPDCGNKRCPHANDHRNACTGSNEPGQEGSAYPAAPQQEVATDNTTQQFESLGLIATSDERKMELPRCSKHPETELQVHPFEQLLSYPPQPVMYCPLCWPSVAKWVKFDKQLRQWKGVK